MKPFDPLRDSEALRAKLREQDDYGRSTDTLLHLVDEFAKDKKLPRLEISRLTVERFKNGGKSRKVDALALLWAYFQSRPEHEKLISTSNAIRALENPASVNAGLRSYFSDEKFAYTSLSLGESGYQFDGYFMMYRQDWRDPDKISATLASIQNNTNNFYEITNPMRADGTRDYYLASEGFMFNRGQFLHFLMREVAGPGMIFGTIDSFTPFAANAHVTRMTGIISGTRHQALIPGTRFYCRRVEFGSEPSTGLFERNEIDCEEALRYLFYSNIK